VVNACIWNHGLQSDVALTTASTRTPIHAALRWAPVTLGVGHFTKIQEVVMQRSGVTSSNIESIGYDSGSSTLEVKFLNGAIYQYYNVPRSIYAGLMSAPSHGSYLDMYVKKGGYSYKRIG
jgi:hypothetical protein